jgi:hypothetical protein
VSVERSKVFDETYRRYIEEIRQLDFLAKADSLGVSSENGALLLPLYDKMYRLSADGIVGEDGRELTPAVQVMLCKYVLTCPPELPEINDKLVTYREFKDSGPLVSSFTTNTNKTLESTFSGNVPGLKDRALLIGGQEQESETYDISIEFHAFPRIPVILNFNDKDDLFPAVCSVLYRSSAALFLDMECLAMTGTLLTGKLISP